MSTSSTPLEDHTSLISDDEQSNQSESQPVSPGLSEVSVDEEESIDSIDQAPDKQKNHGRPPRARYRRAYQTLLKESLTTNAYQVYDEADNVLRSSQNGLTLWSSDEKETLFTSIERRGIDDLRGIAELIGSKSEPEVYVYLGLVKQATKMYHLYEPRPQPVGLFHIPAAHEIGIECITALDAMADACLRKEQQLAEAHEEERYGPFWLLNDEAAAQLEDSSTGNTFPDSIIDNTDLRHALELLNLQALLELSSRMFMNSSILEDNWRSFAETEQTPCLFASAFCDIYELVVSLTKRLVSSALFFAMSRLRCSRSNNYHHLNYVRKADVIAALNVLGLSHNSDDFWVGSARRCKLDMYEHPRARESSTDRLTYEEVENSLRQPRSRSVSMSGVSSSRSPRKRSFENMVGLSADKKQVQNDAGEVTSGSSVDDTASEVSDYVSTSDMDLDKKVDFMPEDSPDNQELYAEAIDQEQSRQEEHKLWAILEKEIPQNTRDHSNKPIKRPRISRKSEQELRDWRDSVEYKSEWEELGL